MKAIVIIARGLHLGYVGCYGNEWIETATLDHLASEGIVFDQHYADCPDSAGVRRCWRTGRYHFPILDGETEPTGLQESDLVSLLGGRNISTFLVVDSSRPAAEEFTAGWDNVIRVAAVARKGTPLERTLEAACKALDRLKIQADWLLWIDLATLVPPWEVPDAHLDAYFQEEDHEEDDEEEDEEGLTEPEEEALTPLLDPQPGFLAPDDDTTFLRLQNSYAAAVSHLDAGLGLLRQELQNRGLLEDVLLIVTTDRGEALGEHGMVGDYCPWLHEELVHLPLFIRLPGGADAGLRIAALTQSVDLMPTLLDWFALPVSTTVHGHSLLPLVRGEVQQVRSHASSGLRISETVEYALRTKEWAFLLPMQFAVDDRPRPPQLFVKPDDRWEVNDVLKHNLEVAELLERTLREFVGVTR